MKRILLIDDETQVRTVLRKMLERAGYSVVEAANGEEGCRLYRSQPTELVITDLTMPEKNGIETIEELMEEYPNIKVVAISGGGQRFPAYFLEKAADKGAQRVLKKPVRTEELLATVSQVIGRAS